MLNKKYSVELNVNKSDLLVGLKSLNGWLWCQMISNKEEGWVPKENLELIEKD